MSNDSNLSFDLPDSEYKIELVLKGDKYGRDNRMTHHSDDGLVEFYSKKSITGDEEGYMISRYYVSTLMSVDQGLTIDSDWSSLDQNQINSIQEWVQSCIGPESKDQLQLAS